MNPPTLETCDLCGDLFPLRAVFLASTGREFYCQTCGADPNQTAANCQSERKIPNVKSAHNQHIRTPHPANFAALDPKRGPQPLAKNQSNPANFAAFYPNLLVNFTCCQRLAGKKISKSETARPCKRGNCKTAKVQKSYKKSARHRTSYLTISKIFCGSHSESNTSRPAKPFAAKSHVFLENLRQKSLSPKGERERDVLPKGVFKRD